MPTARDFCTLALKEAGVLGLGLTANDEDINDSFKLLKMMLAQWQRKRWLVPSLYELAAIGNNQQYNLIGPGQYYNAIRPDKIQAAYFVQLGGQAGFSPGFSPGFQVGSNTYSGPVSFQLIPIWSWEDYARIALKQLGSWPQYFFYDGGFPYGRIYIWPIPSSQYEIHLVMKSPIGFSVQIKAGVIEAQGFGYVDAVYNNVPFVSITGFGSGATADVTVVAGAVTSVVLQQPGQGYDINDKLGFNPNDLGGTGQGLIWSIIQTSDTLDSEFDMPPEYEEAIHYNLTLRVMEMYNYDIPASKAARARASLNTLRIANAQIPTLVMPNALRNNRGNNFYIFNADAR